MYLVLIKWVNRSLLLVRSCQLSMINGELAAVSSLELNFCRSGSGRILCSPFSFCP